MASLTSSAATPAPFSDTSGPRMYSLIERLYPICRSITGDGVRRTLRILAEQVPLTVHEVPSGTRVCDWTVPQEWNIRDAYVKNSQGDRVIDFREHSLHVVSYSIPVRRRMPFTELKAHLHTLPDQPDWIPYRTSYYTPDWGFCLSQRQYLNLREETYEVVIDSSLKPGSLTYGELLLPGETPGEVLISCHICHPSLCNDNLSGIAVAVFLARYLAEARRRYSYRFVFVPGTIGSLTWLAGHEDGLQNIKHGLVLANLGDRGAFTYKKSRRGDAFVDRAMAQVLRHSGEDYRVVDFSPFGYDERQYCSPGFDLPVGCFMRTPEQTRPEYHTSADDLTFVSPECLAGSLEACKSLVTILEQNAAYLNTSPRGEPQLGRRGIYRSMGGPDLESESLALLWMLAYSDGQHALIDIAERSGLPFRTLDKAAGTLLEHGLLTPLAGGRASATQE